MGTEREKFKTGRKGDILKKTGGGKEVSSILGDFATKKRKFGSSWICGNRPEGDFLFIHYKMQF